MSPHQVAVEFDRSGRHLIAYVSGELDHDAARCLEGQITAQVRPHDEDVWLDLAAVSFCGSAGIGMFFRLKEHVGHVGARLRLYTPSSRVLRTLELCGLDQEIAIWRN